MMTKERIFTKEEKINSLEAPLSSREKEIYEINKKKMFLGFTQRTLVLGALNDMDQVSRNPIDWLKEINSGSLTLLSKEVCFDLNKPESQITAGDYASALRFLINGIWSTLDEALTPKKEISEKKNQIPLQFIKFRDSTDNSKISDFYPEKDRIPNTYIVAVFLIDHFSPKNAPAPEEEVAKIEVGNEKKKLTEMDIKSILSKSKKHAKLTIDLQAEKSGVSVEELEELLGTYKVNPFGDLVRIDCQPLDLPFKS